jgi:hypothetical protein
LKRSVLAQLYTWWKQQVAAYTKEEEEEEEVAGDDGRIKDKGRGQAREGSQIWKPREQGTVCAKEALQGESLPGQSVISRRTQVLLRSMRSP